MEFKKLLFMIFISFFVLAKAEALTRNEIILTAKTYKEMKWTCYAAYYSSSASKWIYESDNTYYGMAWSWNRWDTEAEFRKTVETNKMQPVQEAGIDCSGFVSRCWEFSWKEGTYNLENLSIIQGHTIYTLGAPGDFSNLLSGDMLVDYDNMGHAMIVYSVDDDNKKVYIYDAAVRTNEYKVDCREYKFSYVEECTPRSYFEHGIEEQSSSGYKYYTYNISPNPFYSLTQIKYALPTKSHITLKVYTVSGRLVKTLVDGKINPGTHTIVWNGRDKDGNSSSNGIYFIKFSTKDFCETKKVILLK